MRGGFAAFVQPAARHPLRQLSASGHRLIVHVCHPTRLQLLQPAVRERFVDEVGHLMRGLREGSSGHESAPSPTLRDAAYGNAGEPGGDTSRRPSSALAVDGERTATPRCGRRRRQQRVSTPNDTVSTVLQENGSGNADSEPREGSDGGGGGDVRCRVNAAVQVLDEDVEGAAAQAESAWIVLTQAHRHVVDGRTGEFRYNLRWQVRGRRRRAAGTRCALPAR